MTYREQLLQSIWRLSLHIGVTISLLICLTFVMAKYAIHRYGQHVFESYSSEQRMFLFPGTLRAEDFNALRRHIAAFSSGRTGDKIRLELPEINYLFAYLAPIADSVRLTHIAPGRIEGQISLPVAHKGAVRYLNGDGEFSMRLKEKNLVMSIKHLNIGGIAVSDAMIQPLRKRNLVWPRKSLDEMHPAVHAVVAGLQAIEIGDGWLEAVKG